MDPENVAARRSTIFQRIQLELTQSSVIQKRLSPGKFPTSSVGVVKLIAVIFLFSGAISFLTYETCPKTSNWYEWLFALATSLGAGITIIFYSIFTLGIAQKYPAFWFISDITLCILSAIFIIVTSVITIEECTAPDTAYKIPGPLGICGAVFLIIAGAGLYIMYRHQETIVQESPPEQAPVTTLPVFSDV